VAAERAQQLCDSRVAYRRVAIQALDGALLRLVGGIELHCAAFAHTLEGCDEAGGVRPDARDRASMRR
jgi:hypothetical protein